jgi:hypothetical protein
MLFLYIITTGVFILSPFMESLSQKVNNPILGYLIIQLQFYHANKIFFFLGISAVLVYFFTSQRHHTKQPVLKRLIIAFVHTVKVFAISLSIAGISIYLIAWLQLNIFSAIVSLNPSILGVSQNTEKIAQRLRTNEAAPKIVVSSEDSRIQTQDIAKITTGLNTFYSKYILSSIPKQLMLPTKPLGADMFMVDNTLVFAKLNSKDLNAVTPILGHLYIKEYFQTRRIKSYPLFTIMDIDSYNVYRTQNSFERLSDINSEVGGLNQNISSMSATIVTDKNILTDRQTQLQTAQNNKSIITKKCNSKGVYHSGTIFDQYPTSECANLQQNIDAQITSLQNDLDSIQKKVNSDQDKLSVYTAYKEAYNTKSSTLISAVQNLGNERGVYEPPDSIKMILESSDPQTVADFLEILVHEYLHYASYNPDKKIMTFFEEGLTEYFTRQIILYNLDIPAKFGYPIPTAIIQEMTNSIDESEFANIYFSKDQAQLEKTLDRVYGDGFYARNQVYFQTLLYSSNQAQTLKIANTIMHQIGGRTLTEKDGVSKVNSVSNQEIGDRK